MMKTTCFLWIGSLLLAFGSPALAEVEVDFDKYAKSLGGWESKKKRVAEYEMADNRYRTFRPDLTPTPDGGLFISVRIDHVRGFFASDDHANLEMTLDRRGKVVSTRSSISIQGKRITSDLISGSMRGAGQAASRSSAAGSVAALGTDLMASLTEKLSKESKVEPGRVSFPSVVQHNFNLLYQAIQEKKKPEPKPQPDVVVTPALPQEPTATEDPSAEEEGTVDSAAIPR